jgi:hypothetical protein
MPFLSSFGGGSVRAFGFAQAAQAALALSS